MTTQAIPAAHRHLDAAIQRLLPLSLADTSWDNVGWMVQTPEPRQVEPGTKQRVLLCIDLTTAVCNEALEHPSTTLIVTYHPPIFSGLKSLSLSGPPLQRSLLRCLAKGVSVLTVHTAADNVVGGTNDLMAQALVEGAGAGKVETVSPAPDPPAGHEGAGTGRLVTLSGEGYGKEKVVEVVKACLGRKWIQAAWSDEGPSTMKTIAICAGSGGSVLKGVKADLYLTGELGHHEILAFNAQGIHCLVCNHSATERPWLKTFAPRLTKAMNEAAERDAYEVAVSEKDREPLEVV